MTPRHFSAMLKVVGQRVNAFGLSWLVTGVYDHEWLSDVYIPFTTAMAIGGTDGKVSNLQVKLKGMKTMEDADRATSEVPPVWRAPTTTTRATNQHYTCTTASAPIYAKARAFDPQHVDMDHRHLHPSERHRGCEQHNVSA